MSKYLKQNSSMPAAPAKRRTQPVLNIPALLSLIFSMVAYFWIFKLPFACLAVILGIVGWITIAKSKGGQKGVTMAIFGLVGGLLTLFRIYS